MPEDILPPEPTTTGAPSLPEAAHQDLTPPETSPDPEPQAAEDPAADAGPEGQEHEEEAAAPEGEEAPAAAEGDGAAAEAAPPQESNKRWYVVKVQSGREESIREAIERRVKKEGLEEYFGQIIIPVERVTEVKNNKRVFKERKLYPGYLMAEVEYNDRILYLFRETSGVGDFVGGTVHRPPPPMGDREVEAMLRRQGTISDVPSPSKPPVDLGDRVKVKDGTFAGMEGEVKEILEAVGRVRVELTIFGRPVPVELEYWQVEQV